MVNSGDAVLDARPSSACDPFVPQSSTPPLLDHPHESVASCHNLGARSQGAISGGRGVLLVRGFSNNLHPLRRDPAEVSTVEGMGVVKLVNNSKQFECECVRGPNRLATEKEHRRALPL